MATQNVHLGEEQLAALLEDGLRDVEKAAAEDHLLRCRFCMAAYADAVRLRDEWVRSTGFGSVPAELRELGCSRFPGASAPTKGDGLPAHSHPRPRPAVAPTGDRRRWLVAAVLPLVMVGLGWLGLSGPRSGADPHPAMAAVLSAVHEASHHGMILPGSGSAAWAPAATFRASGQTRPDLDEALVVLADRPADNAAQLLRAEGLLATGRLDLARLLTANARRELPSDTSWQTLAAVVSYRENDLARAELLLRGVLVAEPGNSEARFNLGLVLAAGDGKSEARRLFSSLADQPGRPLVQQRARLELERLDNERKRG